MEEEEGKDDATHGQRPEPARATSGDDQKKTEADAVREERQSFIGDREPTGGSEEYPNEEGFDVRAFVLRRNLLAQLLHTLFVD